MEMIILGCTNFSLISQILKEGTYLFFLEEGEQFPKELGEDGDDSLQVLDVDLLYFVAVSYTHLTLPTICSV